MTAASGEADAFARLINHIAKALFVVQLRDSAGDGNAVACAGLQCRPNPLGHHTRAIAGQSGKNNQELVPAPSNRQVGLPDGS